MLRVPPRPPQLFMTRYSMSTDPLLPRVPNPVPPRIVFVDIVSEQMVKGPLVNPVTEGLCLTAAQKS
ncbi:unnamed protein product [Anisakis simplex]|uniref:Uncharacterized protein n=1 Tax=Anisakis simplex TaxID=6269 RepID=A0A0M3K973_ANISI|nr:unnamed protein product [Anisakis simplex]